MPIPIFTYPYDPTGLDPNNRVQGEVHSLSARPIRVLAPQHGAYYTESVAVYDNITNTLLTKGSQYECVQLLQEASVKIGKDICTLILIKDSNVNSEVRINYQVVGGNYSNNISNIVSMYEAVANDNRTVDWVNVQNKPLEYPPTLHNQLLSSVYGFEPVVAALERLRQSIILSNVPAFESLIDWIYTLIAGFPEHIQDMNNPHQTTKNQVGLGLVENYPVVTEAEILAGIPVDKYMTFRSFLTAIDIYGGGGTGFTVTSNKATLNEGDAIIFTVETPVSIANGTVMYWEIVSMSPNPTSTNDFVDATGTVTINNHTGSFTITSRNDVDTESDEYFKVVVRKTSPSGQIACASEIVTLINTNEQGDNFSDIMRGLLAVCPVGEGYPLNATIMSVSGNISDARRMVRCS